MAKKKIEPKTEPAIDNTHYLSLSAEVAIDQIFLGLRNPTINDMVVFASDVCLRAANIIKQNAVGETEREKIIASLDLIHKVCVDSIPLDNNAEVEE